MSSEVPTISITNPDSESQDLALNSPVAPSPPESPTVFDVVKNMEALDRDELCENEPEPDVQETAPDDIQEPAAQHDPHSPENPQQPVSHDQQQEPTDQPERRSTSGGAPTQGDQVEQLAIEQPPHDIREFYQQKTVFLTGATGFVGKAVLWKLLNLDVKKVFLLLRPGQRLYGSTGNRLEDDVLSDKAFVSLRRSMGPTSFDRMIKDKIHAIRGDLAKPALGLNDDDRKSVVMETNVILHCAAVVDGSENLANSIRVNVLGTMDMLDIANECMTLSAFIHMSPLQVQHSNPAEDHLFAVPGDDADAIVQRIMASTPEDMPSILDYCREKYPDGYLLSKSLAEHLITREVGRIKENGAYQFPIAIMRSSPIGPSVAEPLVGWADGVNGVNGTILLTGRGTRVIQASSGNSAADVVPVDYVVRMILGCAATINTPKSDYRLPSSDPVTVEQQQQQQPNGSTPAAADTSTTRDSGSTAAGVGDVSNKRLSTSTTRSFTRQEPSPERSNVFPYIYHVSMINLRCLTWRAAYEPIRQYWTQAIQTSLPPAQQYFATGVGLNRARTVMNSIRSAASSYMNSNNNSTNSISAAEARARKRNSHRLSNCVDKATKLQPTIRSLYKDASIIDNNALRLRRALISTELDPHSLVPEDADHGFWRNYLLNACYGIHYYVCMEPDLRLPVPLTGWNCALESLDMHGDDTDRLIDRPAQSVVFSPDQINRRIARMVAQVRDVLSSSTPDLQEDERWLGDMDDCLDDWSHDSAVFSLDKDARMVLGKWKKKVGSHDDKVKIVILNDKRVNNAITQITHNAGVHKQTAMNEANRILVRMSERTQLQFVWFAGYFLKSLFDDMFENVRIEEDSIRRIRAATLGKRVVFVPVMKSAIDPLLVWYIAIRYQLPVPAFACDEIFAQLGPLSDIYRLSGAYYIKRDRQERSPLNSAVMAAYTQVLLREHGALSMCLERARSRSGKYQEAYDDGLIDMIVESTLQSNQPRSPAVSRVSSLENSPPASPDTPSSLVGSPTMSVDSSNGNIPRKVHRDVFMIPINITYENPPELAYLVDDLLDQHPAQSPASPGAQVQGVVRPSEAMDKRNKSHENGNHGRRKFGRALVGVGPLVSVQDAVEDTQRTSSGSVIDPSDESVIVKKIIKQVQENQRKALIVSPVSLVSAIVLYGRATGGVSFGKLKDMAEWLRAEVISRGYQIDWQEGEDVDSVVLYAFRLLDDNKNIVIEGKHVTDDTNIRVNDHADNVMALAYYANQVMDVFLLDAFFSVVYLSFAEDVVMEDEFMDRFRFLVQMLEREFVLSWDYDERFNTVLSVYERRKVIKKSTDENEVTRLHLAANMESNSVRYEQLMFLASLLYPTIDSYWITSCSLSALEAVPMLPRSIVPLLAQWIATHLITGRRTIFREVLSTESSRMAADVFMGLGFLNEMQAKEKLSPDAQILLHELGIPTSEALIVLSGQSNEATPQTPVSPEDGEAMMKALMAQIQMNRANSNMADLCQQIDSYRLGSMSQRETFQNKQVFQKCLKQIKGILQANTGFAKKRQIELPENEERLVQLVYALRTSSSSNLDRASSQGGGGGAGSGAAGNGRALRRISEAYNLRY